jgi:D-alanine-D-alanine ligase
VTIIEANPNPDIAFGEEVAEAAHAGGMEYEQMIERIVKLALQRYR